MCVPCAAKGPAGSGDSWDPSSDTPSLDKGARVTDPRTPREERSDLSPTDVSTGSVMISHFVLRLMCLFCTVLGLSKVLF